MAWQDRLAALRKRRRRPDPPQRPEPETPLTVERLESRTLLDASSALASGVLSVLGDANNDRILVSLDNAHGQLVVTDNGKLLGQYAATDVTKIAIDAGGGNNVVRINRDVTQDAVITGGAGHNVFYAGGGTTVLLGGTGDNKLVAGSAPTVLTGGTGTNRLYGGADANVFQGGPNGNLFYGVKDGDVLFGQSASDRVIRQADPPPAVADPAAADPAILTSADIDALLGRAAGASASNDAIIVVVDRNGQPLGIRVEGGVDPAITANHTTLTFAIDGALAKARTAAFFANNQAPLTSRTVQFISQSTITQREVDSSPDVSDPNSPLYGPGFVAPVGVGGHFPPNVANTPQVDLFAIEHTNRDSLILPGPDGVRGTADDITLPNRFNIPSAFLAPGVSLPTPESYGFYAFPASDPAHFAQSRGIATLPGGIPLYKNGQLVGGIGVFFPGKTGYATEENSQLSTTYDPTKPDRSLEAEYIAFAAAGGSSGAGASIPTVAGIGFPAGETFDLPSGRIDLVGITLDIYGPGGQCLGPQALLDEGKLVGVGDPASGSDAPLSPTGATRATATTPADGWLVTPHDGNGLTAADVTTIINQGIAQANATRAAIRLPLGSRTRMVFAVADRDGNILGLYRMPDATIFSIDVAVAKARNEAYYNNAGILQPADQVPGVPPGAALTARTFRYLAEPRFPEGIDGAPLGPFSILNDGGADPFSGLEVGPPLPGSAFNSVLGFDSFHPDRNFHDPFNLQNQNGVVFFPGSSGLYKSDAAGNRILAGGLGVSGDGVDQDDVVTFAAVKGYEPSGFIEADQYFVNGVRLPYMKFNRNPLG